MGFVTTGKGAFRGASNLTPNRVVDAQHNDEKTQFKTHSFDDVDPDSLAGQILQLNKNDPSPRGRAGILAAYHEVPMFRAVNRRIASSVAEVQWWVEREGEQVEHDLIDALRMPNPLQTSHEFRMLQQLYFELLGEAFTVVQKTGANGAPLERPWLVPVPPTAVSREGGAWVIEYDDSREFVPANEMIWVKDPDVRDPYGRGIGTGRALQDEIEIVEYAAEHEKKEFANNARPDFLVFLPGATQEKTDRFEQMWFDRLHGVDNTGRGLFLGGPADAKAQFQEVSRKLSELSVDALREFSDQLIRRTQAVPPEILGVVENSNRATIGAAKTFFAEFVQLPRLRHWQREWTHKLFPHFENTDDLSLQFRDPRPDNKERQLEAMKEFPHTVKINEWRRVQGLESLGDEGEKFLRPAPVKLREVDAPESDPEETEQVSRSKEQIEAGVVYMVDRGLNVVKTPEDKAEEIANSLDPFFLASETEETYEKATEDFFQATSQEELGIEPNFALVNPFIADHVEEYTGDKVVNIVDSQQNEIKRIVSEGFRAGKNPHEIMDEIDKMQLENIIPNRSEVIARTEMLRASNFGTFQAHRTSGIVKKREWVAASDTRVRATHGNIGGIESPTVLDGQVVAMDESFEIPPGNSPLHGDAGAKAKYPGDFGIARQDIQCRCTTVAVIPDREAPVDRTKAWKRFDERLERWETRFVAEWRSALRRMYMQKVRPKAIEVLRLNEDLSLPEVSDAS